MKQPSVVKPEGRAYGMEDVDWEAVVVLVERVVGGEVADEEVGEEVSDELRVDVDGEVGMLELLVADMDWVVLVRDEDVVAVELEVELAEVVVVDVADDDEDAEGEVNDEL